MYDRVALVHYHEIGLKGRNRGPFERRLMDNLASATRELGAGTPRRISSRILVPVEAREAALPVADAIAATPGVTSVSLAMVVPRSLDEMCRAADMAVAEFTAHVGRAPATFAIRARRSSTDFPTPSDEMNIRIGDHVRVGSGMRVDLDAPDVTVHVEVVNAYAYVYAVRIEGIGGLPVGTAGRVVSLLSAGIDSPVATWRMAKRGAVVIGVHFSGRPATDGRSVRAVDALAHVLEGTGGLGRVYVVSFGDVQREISLAAPPDLRVLLYRRFMIRVAERIAAAEHARALVTGESLGQVASQTLDNIASVDAVANLPVLRPLIGMDKNEIMADARRIGTFDISTEDHDDCCTLFMPRTPETHATPAQCDQGEAGLDVEALVEQAMATLEYIDYRCPAFGGKARRRSALPRQRVHDGVDSPSDQPERAEPRPEGEPSAPPADPEA